jgi:hypothetical protein
MEGLTGGIPIVPPIFAAFEFSLDALEWLGCVDSSQKVDLSQWRLWLAARSKRDGQLSASLGLKLPGSYAPMLVIPARVAED